MTKPKLSIADSSRLGYVGSDVRKAIDSRNDDWYTPTEWLHLADRVLKGIDLDPFSSDSANRRVGAKRYFTINDNAFEQEWKAESVWMNPPYTRGLVAKAADKFIHEFELGNFKRGMILVNNMTDTRWYKRLDDVAVMSSNLTGRIAFENGAGQRISGNTRGQTLFLFCSKGRGANYIKKRFAEEIKAKGSNVKVKV